MSQFFKSWTLADVTCLTATIELHPTFDYSEVINSVKDIDETESGKVKQYKLSGGSFDFNIPLTFISSEDTNQIRAWWLAQTELRFITTGSNDSAKYVDCRIANTNDPFNQFTRFQSRLRFDGSLNLVSTRDYNTNRGIQQKALEGPYFVLGTSDGILAINALG